MLEHPLLQEVKHIVPPTTKHSSALVGACHHAKQLRNLL
jgi:hypothetical protein